jgi:hypothetical protein
MENGIKKVKLKTGEEVFVYRYKGDKSKFPGESETYVDCAGCALEYSLNQIECSGGIIKELKFTEKEYEKYLTKWEHKSAQAVNQ